MRLVLWCAEGVLWILANIEMLCALAYFHLREWASTHASDDDATAR